MLKPLALPNTDQGSLVESESEVALDGSSPVPKRTPRALVSVPFRPTRCSQKPKPPVYKHTIRQSAQYFKLPENIQAINESRRVVGKKEFEERQRQLGFVSSNHQSPIRQASPPSKGNPAVDKLSRQLENIFQTLNLSGQLHVSPPVFDKKERSTMLGELSKLLVTLNRLIEDSEGGIRGVFYDASGSRIDQVFAKLKSLSSFVRRRLKSLRVNEKTGMTASDFLYFLQNIIIFVYLIH